MLNVLHNDFQLCINIQNVRGGQTADLFCLKVLNEHVAFVCVCVATDERCVAQCFFNSHADVRTLRIRPCNGQKLFNFRKGFILSMKSINFLIFQVFIRKHVM